jgi:enoyl-[acyl-carrier protein] reductase II
MNLRTPLCDLLDIDNPIMLAGMGGVSYGEVCAAVSEAGGYGSLGMAGRTPEEIRQEMKKVRSLTKKPFGVDLLAAVPESLDAAVDIIIDEGASAFIAGLGVPGNIMVKLKDAGLKVVSMCGTVRHAKKAADAGCDAVVAQGTEAGGHTGKVAGMALIPQVIDAVNIPVIAAGSIFDGRGLAASLSFGAVGVWMGTRFIASTEAHAGALYKDAILTSDDEDTIVTRCYSGKTMRVKRNAYVDEWESRPDEIQRFPQQAIVSYENNAMGGIGGQIEGLDPDKSAFAMGQGAGAIHEVLPCAEIIKRTMTEAEKIIQQLQTLRA